MPLLLLGLLFLVTEGERFLPAAAFPTVQRTLYLKLPIAGTRFHWEFRDRRAFLAGELTLRILNPRRQRDQTLVIFRQGQLSPGWTVVGEPSRDSSFYFGLRTQTRFDTAPDDSLIITLVAAEDLPGRGPHSEGTLPKGTWVATGTYSGLYGATLSLFGWRGPPNAYLACWDTVWALRDARDEGWSGPKPEDEKDDAAWHRANGRKGVNGRRCRWS